MSDNDINKLEEIQAILETSDSEGKKLTQIEALLSKRGALCECDGCTEIAIVTHVPTNKRFCEYHMITKESSTMDEIYNTSFDDMPIHTQEAIEVIVQYGDVGGGHHKQWVLDQALRALMGDEYQAWRDKYDLEMAREDYSIWDEGIAP